MYVQVFATYGMLELQPFGMEIEAVGRLAVERIAYDGAVQSVRVGGMHTELVGAAGLGVKSEAGIRGLNDRP